MSLRERTFPFSWHTEPRGDSMVAATKAGVSYFAIVFAFGFLLGALRTMVLVPRMGEPVAVLLEMPVILTISWVVCKWSISFHAVPRHFFKRLLMGSLAFLLLMGAEFTLTALLMELSPDQFLLSLTSLPGTIGLIGQGLFALFPILQANTARPARTHSA